MGQCYRYMQWFLGFTLVMGSHKDYVVVVAVVIAVCEYWYRCTREVWGA